MKSPPRSARPARLRPRMRAGFGEVSPQPNEARHGERGIGSYTIVEQLGAGGGIANHFGNYFTSAVSRDGQRFLVPQRASRATTGEGRPMTVIVNWPTLLTQR